MEPTSQSKAAAADKQPVLPSNIFRYVAASSGFHQLFLVALTVIVFLIEIVPLELQRRIVNDLVKHRAYQTVVVLCLVYAGVVLFHGSTKLALNVYRGWVGERAARDMRQRVSGLLNSVEASPHVMEANGIGVSMIVSEVEPIGGFIGESLSEPLLQGGILLSVIAYMIHLETWMAAAALAFFAPQLVLVPRHPLLSELVVRAGFLFPREFAAAGLCDQNIEIRGTENPRVGGSIPSLGTIFSGNPDT